MEDIGFWYGIGFQSEIVGCPLADMGFGFHLSRVDWGTQQQAAVQAYLLILTKAELTQAELTKVELTKMSWRVSM